MTLTGFSAIIKGDMESIIPDLIFAFFTYFGIRMIKKGKHTEKLLEERTNYVEYFSRMNNGGLSVYCGLYNYNEEEVKKNIIELMNMGLLSQDFLMNAISGKNNDANVNYNIRINSDSNPNLGERKNIKCPYCGAPNTIIVGENNECEYCGSPLE